MSLGSTRISRCLRRDRLLSSQSPRSFSAPLPLRYIQLFVRRRSIVRIARVMLSVRCLGGHGVYLCYLHLREMGNTSILRVRARE